MLHRLLILLFVCTLWPSSRAQAQYLGCDIIQQIPRDECIALESFFEATEGRFWINRAGWLLSNQPCSWFGVTCGPGAWPRNVTKIHLPSNNLGGHLPGELAQLTRLRELVIENNDAVSLFAKMSGSFPVSLVELKELEVVWLSRNALVGTIPPEINRLQALRILRLDDNQLLGTIPETIGELPQLEQLNLGRNRLTGTIPATLGALDNLTHLFLHENGLSGLIPVALGALDRLAVLDLHGNPLTGTLPPALTHLSRLFFLNLSGTRLSGPLNLDVALWASALNNCKLPEPPAGLCLPAHTPFAAAGLDQVCGLPASTDCSICDGTVGEHRAACHALAPVFERTAGTAWLRKSGWLAKPAVCQWEGVQCEGGIPVGLTLPANNLVGSLPASLGNLSTLQTLDLSDNQLRGAIPAAFGNLGPLLAVDLSGNQFAGQVPLAFATVLAQTPSCNLTSNTTSLCFPDTTPYQGLGQDPLCGLPLTPACFPLLLLDVLSFTGRVHDGAIQLAWETDGSSAEVHFTVELRDGEGYQEVGRVPGQVGVESYGFTLEGLASGIHVFRLVQEDANGQREISPPIELLFLDNRLVIEAVFPNPARHQAMLRLAIPTDREVVVSLFDATGRQIRTYLQAPLVSNTLHEIPLGLDGLAGGVYFIRVQVGQGAPETQALVLQR